MRALVITQNITLDGAVEMLDDWFDPLVEDDELTEEMHRQDQHCDALLFGRQTFTDMRGFWPQQVDDTTGFTEQLNRTQKYVVTSTLANPEWQNTMILSGNPIEEVRQLKEQPGQEIVLTGSIRLAHPLIEAGLVNEFRMFTYPVIQGRGRRFFPDGYAVPRLRLLETKSFACGVTYTAYAPEAQSTRATAIR